MSARLVFVFPGQGAQQVGMGKSLAHRFAVAAATFHQADRVLDLPLSKICFDGPMEELTQTEITQPALFTTSVATLRVLHELGIEPRAAAGHSVGEYAALVAAGALEFEAALPVVRKRGELMAQANALAPGAMAAVIGLDLAGVTEICSAAAQLGVVEPSNLNTPTQIVISGEENAVVEVMRLAKEHGGRAIRLKVSAPFHCSLMQPVRKGLEPFVEALPMKDAHVPVIANATGDYVSVAGEIRTALLDQISQPVRWTETISRFTSGGMDQFVEVGPGRVLAGLVTATNPSAVVRGASTAEDIDALVAESQ